MTDLLIPTGESALRYRITRWVAETLANRAVVEPLAETEQFTGRVRGVPSIAAVAGSESEVVEDLRVKLRTYAERKLAGGSALPEWDKPVVEVSDAVKRVVRLSTLRALLKDRCKQWGDGRLNLPAHALDPILADFDQIITRHAMNLVGGNLLTL
jgi:hypothetical protein